MSKKKKCKLMAIEKEANEGELVHRVEPHEFGEQWQAESESFLPIEEEEATRHSEPVLKFIHE
jgi:hypothetical protein